MAKKEAKAATGSVISADRVADYHVSDTKTASGRKSVDTNDALAQKLRGKSVEELEDLARKAGIGDRLKDWKNLNPGMFRMTVGNALRAIERQKNGGGKAKKAKAKKASGKTTRGVMTKKAA